jgi:RND family efflux transporter MFP subunit
MRPAASLLVRVTVTAVMVAIAGFAGWRLWDYYMLAPWTRDGRIRADVVQVAPDVSGLVNEVLVHDNQVVHRNDLLFRVDPIRFRLALEQAQAVVESRAAAAAESTTEFNRFHALTNLEVSTEQQQQRDSAAKEAVAAYQQALADRDVAQLNLDRSEVRATVNGVITNFDMRPGNYVSVGHAVAALVDTDSFYIDGYFEETKLRRIHVGDPAQARLMGGGQPISGHVDSVAGGIADSERSASADLLANVNPTFSWVRLAQRVPVRIAIDQTPPGLRLIAGRTVSVAIGPAR